MKAYDARAAARDAQPANPSRPATALLHDVPDARLLVFRIEPGQEVPPHTNPSTVILTVLEGSGTVSGADGDRVVRAGEVIAYEPSEPHGMRAVTERFVLLAAIVPRPGTR